MGSGKDDVELVEECCARAIILVVNILVGIIGLALLGTGIFIINGQSVYEKATKAVVDGIPSITEGLHLVANKNIADNKLDFAGLLQTVATGLIVFGGALLILSIIGCFGAYCSLKCVMFLYTCILAAILIVQMIFVALFFGKKFNGPIQNQLNNTLVEKYAGIDCYKAECLVFNYVMLKVQCCGLGNYLDFNHAKKWESERIFSIEVYSTIRNVTKTLATPIACCKFSGTFPDVKPINITCYENPLSEEYSYYDTGCWDKILTKSEKYYWTAVKIAALILVSQLIFCCIAIFITVPDRCCFQNKKKNPTET